MTEGDILLWIQTYMRSERATKFFRTISASMDGGAAFLALAGGLTLFRKTRRAGIGGLLSIGAEALIVNVLLKNMVERARPFQKIDGLEVLCPRPHDYSFPSGHTAAAFAGATAIFLSGYKKTGKLLVAYAALVGFSRMYLGVHYPSDVFSGAAIGALTAGMVWGIEKAICRPKKDRPCNERAIQ